MRKGRTYCYDLAYYGPPAWFWPGYFPWKMTLETIFAAPPPWNLFAPTKRVSFPVVWNPDLTVGQYIFTSSADLPVHVDLTMRVRTVSGIKKAEWQMNLSVGIVTYGDYRHHEPIPARHINNNAWEDDHNAAGYGGNVPPYAVYPSPWADSGQHPGWH
jgi:hypothetical protein